MIIDTIELEKILIANWTAFLNPREMIKIATEQARKNNMNGPINGLTVSRFELNSNGFLVWMEFSANNQQRATIEALLSTDGYLTPMRFELT